MQMGTLVFDSLLIFIIIIVYFTTDTVRRPRKPKNCHYDYLKR